MKSIFKRLLALTLVLCIALMLFACGDMFFQEEGVCGQNLTWKINNGVLTISGSGDMWDFYVKLPWGAYKGLIRSVVFKGDITSIGGAAFEDCSSLKSISIPDSVISIGHGAFEGCNSLENITVDKDNTVYRSESNCCIRISDNELVFGCKNSVIPNSVMSIGSYAFIRCSSLTSIVIPDSVTSIGGFAFSNCSSLTSIVIPDSVTSIGVFAFVGCNSLESITVDKDNTVYRSESNCCIRISDNELVFGCKNSVIPNSVTSIGYGAFYECSNLKSISIPDSVTSIGGSAFSGCSSLTSIIIPDSAMSIGSYAFSGCSSLTSVSIPDSVISIADHTFYECSSLTSINIPDGVTSIGCAAFIRCSNLTSASIGNSVTSIGDGAFEGCSNLTSIVIPDSVTSIGEGAFEDCSSLASIVIPDGVTSIGRRAFADTGYYSDESNWAGEDVLYIGNHLIKAKESIAGAYTTRDNIICIADYAFEYCRSLTSIVIPDSVTSIGGGSFRECSSLTSVVIPNSVTSIGYEAFCACSSITIYCEATNQPSDWAEDWNSDSCPVVWGYIFEPEYALNGDGKSYTISGIGTFLGTTLVIPDTYKGLPVTSIGDRAFEDCSSLTSVSIPDSVTSIGDRAFEDCSNLISITVDKNNAVYRSEGNCCIRISDNELVFGCKNSVIPDGVTSIRYYAFLNCSDLTSIVIPDSVTSIGTSAFNCCSCLTNVSIGNSVTSIDGGAFGNCRSLTSISIPDSVTSIGWGAFLDCISLTDVYYAGSEEDRNNISIGDLNDKLLGAEWHYNSN